MNLNDDIVYRCLRLGPLRQLHPGSSRILVRHHNRLHDNFSSVSSGHFGSTRSASHRAMAAGVAGSSYGTGPRGAGIRPWRFMHPAILAGSGGAELPTITPISRKNSGPRTPGVSTASILPGD